MTEALGRDLIGIEQSDDHELVARAKQGDGAAFQELCRRYQERVRERLRWRIPVKLRRKLDVGDVMQAAFATARQRMADFEHRGNGAFAAWLRRIADLKLFEFRRHFEGTAKRDVNREASRGGRLATGMFQGREVTPSQTASAGGSWQPESLPRHLPSRADEWLRIQDSDILAPVLGN